MENFLKKTGWVSVITSVAFAVLGLILILNPEGVLNVIFYVLGTIFVIFGIAKVGNYFMSKGKYDIYNYDLAFGIIAIVGGLITIFCSGTIMSILRIVIGIWIIYSGLVRLGLTLKFRNMDNKLWITVLILAILMIVCGLFITLNSGAILTTIGIIMLIYAVMDLLESLIFVKTVKDII